MKMKKLLIFALMVLMITPVLAQSKYDQLFNIVVKCTKIIQFQKDGLIDSEKANQELAKYDAQMLAIMQDSPPVTNQIVFEVYPTISFYDALPKLNEIASFGYVYAKQKDAYTALMQGMINNYKLTGDTAVLKSKLIELLDNRAVYIYVANRSAFSDLVQSVIDNL